MKTVHKFTILLFCLFVSDVMAEYTVKVIYFVPNDRTFQWNIPNELNTKMKQVQQFYASEMERHNYGRKTFQLETDRNDDLIVHPILGKNNDKYYQTGTLDKIDTETKDSFGNKDIRVIIVDVSTERVQGNCGIARFNGGPVLVPVSGDCVVGNEGVELIAHELGHAFNLEHDFRDDSYIMSYGSNRNELSKCAATMLNVSPFFNPMLNTINTNGTIQMLTPNTYIKNSDFTTRFNVSDPDNIYQVQFLLSVPNEPTSVMDCKHFSTNIQKTEVEFNMPEGATIAPVNNVYIRVVDTFGNIAAKSWDLQIETSTETNTTNLNNTETYLTLAYNSSDALTPINPKIEWYGWREGVWEQTPDGLRPRKPHGFMDSQKSEQYYDNYDYFFYSHAVSKIVYDISNRSYTKFESYFDMPNPCKKDIDDSYASIELICKVDNVEVYNSGLLKGHLTRNKFISFDIPENGQKLTFIITDAYDGDGCDHFIFGEPKLIHGDPNITPVTMNTDINNDGETNVLDLIIVAINFKAVNFNPNADINKDGVVDTKDFLIIANVLDPQAAPTQLTLQTQLFPNYPNPFNPETWIPYQLSMPADVSIVIYNTRGHIVRQLELGYQDTGMYITKEQAAYWDGKNTFGEKVSNGLYFYTLLAGEYNKTRRMLILK